MRRVTLRVRVTVVATIVVLAALVGASTALILTLRATMLANLDDSVEARMGDLVALYEADRLPATLVVDRDAVAQVVGPTGRVVAASSNAGAGPVLDPNGATGRRGTATVELPTVSREPVRVLAVGTGDGGVVVAGAGLGDVEEVTRTAAAYLLVGVALLTALVAALVWIVTGRSLAAVEGIRATVADISGHDLRRRVAQPEVRDEIGQLAATMNAMLDRLESSQLAQTRFVSDASHELSTPIAVMRHQLEVALREIDDVPQVRSVLADLLDEDLRMQRLVEDLLVLARHDHQQVGARHHTLVDLDDIALAESVRLGATRTQVRIDTRAISAGQVRGREDDLVRVVRNLVDNAMRHARTTVAVHLSSGDGRVVLHVDDDGAGIPPEHRGRVFNRFTRLDDSRSRDSGGSGLGLAIVADLVAHHRGSVDVAAAPGLGGARLTVTLPDARADDT